MRRPLARITTYLLGGFFALAALPFAFVYAALQPSRGGVSAVTSPDSQLVAKLIEGNGGATTSFGYTVVLTESGAVRANHEVASVDGTVRNASAYGANLRWSSPDELAIEYLDARSSELLNSKTKIGGREVRVVLRPNVTDPAAPAGGRLYSLQGRPR